MKLQSTVLLGLSVAQPASAAVRGKSTLAEIDRIFADWQSTEAIKPISAMEGTFNWRRARGRVEAGSSVRRFPR